MSADIDPFNSLLGERPREYLEKLHQALSTLVDEYGRQYDASAKNDKIRAAGKLKQVVDAFHLVSAAKRELRKNPAMGLDEFVAELRAIINAKDADT